MDHLNTVLFLGAIFLICWAILWAVYDFRSF